jgi:hypothetical protein
LNFQQRAESLPLASGIITKNVSSAASAIDHFLTLWPPFKTFRTATNVEETLGKPLFGISSTFI